MSTAAKPSNAPPTAPTTITEHEAREVERANATGLQPVVFWPDDPETVAEANAKPEVFAHKTVGQVADHFDAIIRGLTKKPAIIGHSFGGLLVQILAGSASPTP